jgi:Flp pilus assembly protein TadD
MSAYDLLARLYVNEKRLADATAAFQRVAEGQPKAIAPRTAVAVLLEMQNRRDEAKVRYEEVLAIDPRAAVAANNLAQIHADRNENLDIALQLAQAAKAALPNVSEVDDTLGFVYYRKNLNSLAIRSFKQSVAAQPENPLYLLHLGLAYAQNGDKELARQALEKALKNNANFNGADEARKVLNSLKG